ncbi:MAG: helix-turn-helix domain-containing protein [Burkholderiales bacterium]|nr:helix-turn-helix domain-containing protein [Burkholderiales bacterium]
MERLKAAMTRDQAAQVLGVAPRTVRNWEAGRSRVPYSAFKLLRILGGYALPGQAWRGFYLRGDTIWSPEGRSFQATDLAWWGLTVAMARTFREWRSRMFSPAIPPPRIRGPQVSPPQGAPSLPAPLATSAAGDAPRRRPAGGDAIANRRELCGVTVCPSELAPMGSALGGPRAARARGPERTPRPA